MIRILKILTAFATISVLTSCPGGKDDPGGDLIEAPSKAALVFPNNNSECTEGAVVNDNETSITFQWETAANTDSYELNIKNLSTGNSLRASANLNELPVTLNSNTPYEWFVVSKSNRSAETATSDTWQFYNAGAGVSNYAPFPATAISPEIGASIAATTSLSLQWQGNDVDNDIAEFEVLFGTTAEPTASIGVTTQSTIGVTVTSGQTYYWRVISTDSHGNTSQSEIFEFRVQ